MNSSTTKLFVETTNKFVDDGFMPAELPRPTDSELSILRVLWDQGASRVREVAEVLSAERGEEVGYTTVLKLLQIMHGKGLVERDETERSHRYSAAVEQSVTQRQVLSRVTDRLFGGAASELVVQALSSHPSSAEDRERIRELLDELENAERGEKQQNQKQREKKR
jgi:predicted transcriptional regulator